jgi:superfamily II DNA/RNA helicase
VIDEADRILEIGFEEDMRAIIKLLPTQGRQTALFSATQASAPPPALPLPPGIAATPPPAGIASRMRAIIKLLPTQGRQTALFSATQASAPFFLAPFPSPV